MPKDVNPNKTQAVLRLTELKPAPDPILTLVMSVEVRVRTLVIVLLFNYSDYMETKL